MERSCGEDRLATRRRTGRLSKRQARRALPAGRKIQVARFHGKSKRINHRGDRGTQGKEHRGNPGCELLGSESPAARLVYASSETGAAPASMQPEFNRNRGFHLNCLAVG